MMQARCWCGHPDINPNSHHHSDPGELLVPGRAAAAPDDKVDTELIDEDEWKQCEEMHRDCSCPSVASGLASARVRNNVSHTSNIPLQ